MQLQWNKRWCGRVNVLAFLKDPVKVTIAHYICTEKDNERQRTDRLVSYRPVVDFFSHVSC